MTAAINLLLYNQLDLDNRVNCMIADYDAFDPKTGAYMRSSNGRRKAGRPRKYWAYAYGITVRFTAHSDDEAVKIANQKLNDAYAKAEEATK